MKKKRGTIILIVIFVLVLLYLLLTAVLALTNKKDLYTVRLSQAYEVLEVEHAINGLIPIGTDHYYMGVEEETGLVYIIKASPEWFEKNFDSNNMAVDSAGVSVTALKEKESDYKTSSELHNQIAQVQAEGVRFPLGEKYYLDLEYKTLAVTKLVLFAVFIILTVTCIYSVNRLERIKKPFFWCWLVVFIAALIFFLKVVV